MKKIAWMLLAAALLLTACGQRQVSCPAEEEPAPSVPVELLADGEETAPEEQLPKEAEEGTAVSEEEPVPVDPVPGEIPLLGDVPPVLFVVANGETYKFESGNYSWNVELPDGTGTAVIACGPHPLDMQPAEEDFILIEPEGAMEFWFYVEPERVACRCWEERFWGQPEAGEPSAYAVETEENRITPADNQRYVYELTADWGNGCSATYIFFAMRDAIPSGE